MWIPIVGWIALMLVVTAIELRGMDYAPGDWKWLLPTLAVKPGLFIAILLIFWAALPN